MAKVLIVDDEPHIRLLLEQTLEDFEDEGVDIFSSDNGKDALEIIKQEKPDLILLDVMMPGLDGFDVCRAVKKELKMEDAYIILLTSKGQEFDRKIGEEAGNRRSKTINVLWANRRRFDNQRGAFPIK